MCLFDFKEQNEFQNESAQIMQWLLGIADIKIWIWLLDWWTNYQLKADLCTWKYVIQELLFMVTIGLQYANKIDSVPSESFILFACIVCWKKG